MFDVFDYLMFDLFTDYWVSADMMDQLETKLSSLSNPDLVKFESTPSDHENPFYEMWLEASNESDSSNDVDPRD